MKMKTQHSISRRCFLNGVALAGLLTTTSFSTLLGQTLSSELKKRYRFGICDWDLRATGDPKSFEVAKELGFNGVEVSWQPTGPFSLSVTENHKKFKEAATKTGITISSLAMGILNQEPLATTEEAEGWIENCIDTMQELNVPGTLLAFFGKGDIKDDLQARKIVTKKLKRLAPLAAAKNKVLAVESYLNAREHLDLLQAVGNDAVKVYYDEQNMLTKGYPIYDDMELLLKEKAIFQLHVKEYDARLGEGKVDFKKIRTLLEKYDYDNWIVVESSVRGDWKESQAANVVFLNELFNGKGI